MKFDFHCRSMLHSKYMKGNRVYFWDRLRDFLACNGKRKRLNTTCAYTSVCTVCTQKMIRKLIANNELAISGFSYSPLVNNLHIYYSQILNLSIIENNIDNEVQWIFFELSSNHIKNNIDTQQKEKKKKKCNQT